MRSLGTLLLPWGLVKALHTTLLILYVVLFNSSRLFILVLNWIKQPALVVTPTLVTAMTFHLLILREVMEIGRSRARLRVRRSRGSQTTLRQRSPGWKRRRLHLLSWKTRLTGKNQLRWVLQKNLRGTANLRGMYIPARVDRLNLSERTACIIINVC